MSISHLLEDFGAFARGTPVALTDVSLEETRLEAFETGYQAGWEDAVKASADDSRHISADLAQNLQDLSFTYQEAHLAVLTSLKPLLDQILQKVLPALVQKTLGTHVAELLQDLAKTQAEVPVQITTAPANVLALDALLDDKTALDVSVVAEPSLAEGQVFVRFGTEEREIDMSEVLRSIEQAVSDFFIETQRNAS